MNLDRVKERLRKLLRLARESTEVGEAAAAAAQAQALLSKYELAEAQIGELDDGPRMYQAWGDDGLYASKRIPFWVLRLAVNIAALNNCEAFIQGWAGKRVIAVVGVESSVDLVRYVFQYLKREIERLCARHARPTPLRGKRGTKWRNSFKLGATDEVVIRMREAKEEVFRGARSTALARIDKRRQAAASWIDKNKTADQEKPRKRNDARDGYVTGRIVGRDIQLETDLALPEPPKQLETTHG